MKTAFTAKIIFESDKCKHWAKTSGNVVTVEKIFKSILSGDSQVVEIIDDGLTSKVEPVIVFRDTK